MRLLIVGSDKIYSIENFYYKYFVEFGLEVKRYNSQSIFYDYYYSGGVARKLIFKFGLSSIFKQINYDFIQTVKEFNPEIILIFKGMEISPESLFFLKSKGVILVNYNPDNPFLFTGRGSGNKNVTNSIGIYNFHFTYNLEIQKQLVSKFNAATFFLPFGFDLDIELYNQLKLLPEICKVCFLGNPDKIRASFLNKLALKGIEIDVYGNDWRDYISNPNISIFAPVYGKNQWEVLRKYRVQLNLMRIHNIDSHNMRTFEIPGVGGIQLAPRTYEHQLFFKENEEIFLFNDIQECITQINFLLGISNYDADLIRNNARNASVINKHSYRDRAIQVFEKFKELKL